MTPKGGCEDERNSPTLERLTHTGEDRGEAGGKVKEMGKVRSWGVHSCGHPGRSPPLGC